MSEDSEERDVVSFDGNRLVNYLIQLDVEQAEAPVVWAFDNKDNLDRFVKDKLCSDAATRLLSNKHVTCLCGTARKKYFIGWTYVRKEGQHVQDN